jgi:GDPmannose 4,6-dehydratase
LSKARDLLCWEPRVTFDNLVTIMVDYDLIFADLEPIGKGVAVCREKNFLYTNHHVALQQSMHLENMG